LHHSLNAKGSVALRLNMLYPIPAIFILQQSNKSKRAENHGGQFSPNYYPIAALPRRIQFPRRLCFGANMWQCGMLTVHLARILSSRRLKSEKNANEL
jgi:hypothetical protein